MKQNIEADLKTAMLAHEQDTVTTLRGLKSAIQNAEIEARKELTDDEVLAVLQKEAKRRREAITMYEDAGETDRANNEKRELTLIEAYLPAMADEETIKQVIENAVSETGASSMQDMGKVMGVVTKELAGTADGAVVARLVKERLSA